MAEILVAVVQYDDQSLKYTEAKRDRKTRKLFTIPANHCIANEDNL